MASEIVDIGSDLGDFTSSENKYEILGVLRTASADEIRTAYRRAAFLYHPDRHLPAARQHSESIFKRVQAAYSTLKDRAARREYDASLDQGRPGSVTEEAKHQQIDPLEVILQEILKYESVFKGMLDDLPPEARKAVIDSLIKKPKEVVVADWRLSEVPLGDSHVGVFQNGWLVLTNLRVICIYTTQQITQSGNVQTTTTYSNGFAVTIPGLSSVRLRQERRVRRRVAVSIDTGDKRWEFVTREANLSKLMLILWLWGVAIDGVDESSEEGDWIYLVWVRSWKPAVITAVVVGGLGLCADGSLLILAIPIGLTVGALVTAMGLLDFGQEYRQRKAVDVVRDATATE